MRHVLQAFVADLPGYVCDKCHKIQPDRALLASCRVCEWDLCADCVNATAFHVIVFGATTYSLKAYSTWRGCHVKLAIEELTGIPAWEQTLLLPDSLELCDDEVLVDCLKASSHATLRLLLPPLAAPRLDTTLDGALDGALESFPEVLQDVLRRLGERSLRASPVVAVLHGLGNVADAPRWRECAFLWGRFLWYLHRRLTTECPEALLTKLQRAARKETATLVSVMLDLDMKEAFSVNLVATGLSGEMHRFSARLTWDGHRLRQEIYRRACIPVIDQVLLLGQGALQLHSDMVLGDVLLMHRELYSLSPSSSIDVTCINSPRSEYLDCVATVEEMGIQTLQAVSPSLLNDRFFIGLMTLRNWRTLLYASQELQADMFLALTALRQTDSPISRVAANRIFSLINSEAASAEAASDDSAASPLAGEA